MKKPRVVIVMGVSGSGKSTIGEQLAIRHHGKFFDADDFHPAANVAKMAAGHPLDDADRRPWLERLRTEVIDRAPEERLTVLACSALKQSYRRTLDVGHDGVVLVYLKGDRKTLEMRMDHREHHYMKSNLLDSQLATLEEPAPDEALTVSIDPPPAEIIATIERALGLHFPS